MYANYHSHLDKLHLSFQSISYSKFESANHPDSKIPFYFKEVPATKDYGLGYNIYWIPSAGCVPVLYGVIDLSYRFIADYSMMYVLNPTLYTIGWSDALNDIIYHLGLSHVQMREIELSIDTNQPIIKRFVKKMLAKEIVFKETYKASYYGTWDDVYKYGYEEAKFHNTQYIMPLKDSKRINKHNYDRFESKSNEIFNHSGKHYINRYLSKYLDVDRPVYRLEKTLYRRDLSYRDVVYVDITTGRMISKSTYNRLCDIDKRRYRIHSKTSILDVDLSRLEDSKYITSIFNHFSVFNSEIVLDTYKNVPLYDAKYVKEYKAVTPKAKKTSSAQRQKDLRNAIRISELELTYDYTENAASGGDDIFNFDLPVIC